MKGAVEDEDTARMEAARSAGRDVLTTELDRLRAEADTLLLRCYEHTKRSLSLQETLAAHARDGWYDLCLVVVRLSEHRASKVRIGHLAKHFHLISHGQVFNGHGAQVVGCDASLYYFLTRRHEGDSTNKR